MPSVHSDPYRKLNAKAHERLRANAAPTESLTAPGRPGSVATPPLAPQPKPLPHSGGQSIGDYIRCTIAAGAAPK